MQLVFISISLRKLIGLNFILMLDFNRNHRILAILSLELFNLHVYILAHCYSVVNHLSVLLGFLLMIGTSTVIQRSTHSLTYGFLHLPFHIRVKQLKLFLPIFKLDKLIANWILITHEPFAKWSLLSFGWLINSGLSSYTFIVFDEVLVPQLSLMVFLG